MITTLANIITALAGASCLAIPAWSILTILPVLYRLYTGMDVAPMEAINTGYIAIYCFYVGRITTLEWPCKM